jgi:hypothetical protein
MNWAGGLMRSLMVELWSDVSLAWTFLSVDVSLRMMQLLCLLFQFCSAAENMETVGSLRQVQ